MQRLQRGKGAEKNILVISHIPWYNYLWKFFLRNLRALCGKSFGTYCPDDNGISYSVNLACHQILNTRSTWRN